MTKQIKDLQNYEIIINKYIEEINSNAWLLKHKKTGARVVLFSNDDNNKVFNIGFRTPVSDDTGVPHIIEHTVLCGSEKYPIKDPFMELVKGSLNTFINAMTYPDKTVYPVASYNDQDFKNLMSVYMDAVFHPNIYKEENIFKQEGWHFELDDVDGELTYNGIVYNEMKGVYSTVDGVLGRVSLQSLYPDTGYAYESGGDPVSIPDLTYENYLDFHRRYYHPSNSYIYLYGDMDMVERLEWIDKEYLSKYDYLEIDSTIKNQKPFDKPIVVTRPYAIADNEDEKDNAVLSENYVIGDGDDIMLGTAFQIIEYAIMEMPGAPLKQAIIDAGIGKDVYGQYEDDVKQPFYSIVAKYANEADKDRFSQVIRESLEAIVENGIDKDTLRAGLNSLEFKTREADFGRIPKGLMFGLQIMATWLYDENNPFETLESNKVFEDLRKAIDTDYYEQIIKKYLIDNNHKSMVILTPEKGLTQKKEQELKDKLSKIKEGLSVEERQAIVDATKALKEYQDTPSTPEQLEMIPLLEISDIEKSPKPFISKKEYEGDLTFLHNDLFTNGIAYIDVVFNHGSLPKKYHNYAGLLKSILSYMDTDKRKYTDLNTEIDLNFGGFSFSTAITKDANDDSLIRTVELHTKLLYEKMDQVFDIATEIINGTQFDDYKRLKEILEEVKSRVQENIISSGDSAALLRAMSYYSEAHYLKEQMTGISFYDFLKELLDDYDNRKEEIAAMLKETVSYVFGTDNVILNYAGDKEHFEKAKELTPKMVSDISYEKGEGDNWTFEPIQKNEAFVTPGQVQFVCRAGNYNKENENKFTGHMPVFSNIMKSEYLWNNIRVLGGAYGCNSLVTRTGDIAFTSYRDPNLKATSDVYFKASEFVRNLQLDDRQMRKFIIGTISSMDMPMPVSDRSQRELSMHLMNMNYSQLQRERDEILSTNVEDIRNIAELVDAAMDCGNVCVVGGKNPIEESKEMFNSITELK